MNAERGASTWHRHDAQRTAPDTGRPNRILIALAAAWIIVSLAIGGAA